MANNFRINNGDLAEHVGEIDAQLAEMTYLSSNFKRFEVETSDSVRLQRAIDFTSSIKATLQITEPMLLRTTVNLKHHTSLFCNNENAKIYTDVGSSKNGMIMLLGKSINNIKIKGLNMEGMGYGETNPVPTGSVEGSGSGIMLADCENILIEGNTVTKCGGYKGNEGVGNIWLSCCRHAKIINNTVSIGGNLICVDRWYAFNQGYENIYNLDIVVANNNLFYCSGRGIALENINDRGSISVTGNTFSGIGYSFIEGRNFTNCNISNNVCDGSKDLKINPRDYWGIANTPNDDINWNWNTWDDTQFGIEIITDAKEAIITDNNIRNVKFHGIKANNCQNSIITDNKIINALDTGIYLKNADNDIKALLINDNLISGSVNGVIVTKDDGNLSSMNNISISNNTIISKIGINGKELYMATLSNNTLRPITTYGGSIGIRTSNSSYCNFNGNTINQFTIGQEISNDTGSFFDDKLLNNTTGMRIATGSKMVIRSVIRGGTTAINNTDTTLCNGTNIDFIDVGVLKTSKGISVKSYMSMTTVQNQPLSGVWEVGDKIYNSTPLIGRPYGIICTGNSGVGNVGQWKNISIILEN